jgi:hypothetical protein
MDEQTLIAIVVVAGIALVALLAYLTLHRRRSEHLRDRFGDEYDRTVDDVGKRRVAEANLMDREKRVDALDIRPLTASERDGFAAEWLETKALFVDSPAEAVLRADRLLARIMETRGFPMGDFDRRYEDLTVDHAAVARHYRDGHEVAVKKGDATTEEMRRGLNNFEKLFEDLMRDGDSGTVQTRTADIGSDPQYVSRDRPSGTAV